MGLDATYRTSQAGTAAVGVLLATISVTRHLRFRVFHLALRPPQDPVPVQARPFGPPSLQQPQLLGHSVPPSVRTGVCRNLHHHLALVVCIASSDPVVLPAVVHNGQRGCPHRVRPAPAAPSMDALLGWIDQARHAPPEAADQLRAVLQLVRPTHRHRVPGPTRRRVQAESADGLGEEG